MTETTAMSDAPWDCEFRHTRSIRNKIETKRHKPNVWAMPSGSARSVLGPGWLEFTSDGAIALSGSFQFSPPRELMAFNIVFMTGVLAVASGLDLTLAQALTVLVIGGALGLVLSVLYSNWRGYSKSIVMPFKFRPEDIQGVGVKGPELIFRFRHCFIPGCKVLKLYVAPHCRREFFAEFDEALPGVLPQSYRDALARQSADGDRDRSFVYLSSPPPLG
ncbi:MAG: hypothetical protein AMXMBFR82_51750 [Candidatus Hydrogenedentota bacterium]